ncbi:class I SAM-dependent methyltransferase [Halocynthiibacter namhaensis]|uniref:class I SAM-dependent methyltransferase n=1 Tax=Halocynthiibacter namhaensis TaxID=1290553 RepID=UPI000578E90D|nr:SAM-dependent methyltransferase [Halocynthiibacter namhaensis]
MSALLPHLIERIQTTGPLSIAEYMQECLLHPTHGYYATRDPFGADGDFTTAPEISQMFGELLGLCLAQAWLDRDAPKSFILAEPGPGRGTLMADIMRATRSVPGFHAAANLYLIEASATLRGVQKETLADYDVTWCDAISDLPHGTLLLVANEFLDALPIRQFLRDGTGWRERRVGLPETPDTLIFGAGESTQIPALAHRLHDTKYGDLVEINAAARATATEISQRIARDGGLALLVDYGSWHSTGDTFQALKSHQFIDPLLQPGDADLTAHVDFEPLTEEAETAGIHASGLTHQGVLLERLGITGRAQALAANMTGETLDAHISAHRRLTHPEEMGTLFKALALFAKGTPPPPGFNPPGANSV